MTDNSPQWLAWAREIQAMTQTGLTYSKDDYDIKRYKRLTEIAAEMVASHTQLSKEALVENFQIQPGYATPKVDVRAAIFRDGKILLVQESADGKWAMPGGWADVGEFPAAMAAREAWEESGFTVRVDKVIGVYDANRYEPLQFYHAYKLVFLCSIISGAPTTSSETLAVEFFDPANLPPLSEIRTNQMHIDEALAHLQDPNRPAYFE